MAEYLCLDCNRSIIDGADHTCHIYVSEDILHLPPRLEEGEKINERYGDDIHINEQEEIASKLSDISIATASEGGEMSLEESKWQSLNNDHSSFMDYLESATHNARSDTSNASVPRNLINIPDSPTRNNEQETHLITGSGAVTDEHVSSEVHFLVLNNGEKMSAEVNPSLTSMKCDDAVAEPSGMCNLKRTFSCCLCSEQFDDERNLVAHFRTHTGDNLVCRLCGKRFRYTRHLVVHYRIHTGEKPFVCDECEKAFAVEANLKIHYRIHTGVKPFVCDVCKRGFNQKNTLNRHIRTHTGEMPFKCPVCGRLFRNKSNCKKHQKIIHK